MTTLANAPLIEVAAEIRWAALSTGPDGETTVAFTEEERAAIAESLHRVLSQTLPHSETFAAPLEDVPFSLSRRYRPAADKWPVVQTGLGTVAINQVTDGYSWDSFRSTVVDAFSLVTSALQAVYPDGPPYLGIELMYVDGLHMDAGETPEAFLHTKMRARLLPPPEFLTAPFMMPQPNVTSASLSFEIGLKEPPGVLTVELQHESRIFGRPGFIMDTRVRSIGDVVEYSPDGIGIWLDAAHVVQQHAFRTLIEPAYLESFR